MKEKERSCHNEKDFLLEICSIQRWFSWKTYLNGQEEIKNDLFIINWQFVSNPDVSGYKPNVENHEYREA